MFEPTFTSDLVKRFGADVAVTLYANETARLDAELTKAKKTNC
jgi:hypothetical protein